MVEPPPPGIAARRHRKRAAVTRSPSALNLGAATDHMDALETWRVRKVLPHVRGRLLDLACGFNHLVHRNGSGVITMIGLATGLVAHILFDRDEAARGGMEPGELRDMRRQEVRTLLAGCGFTLETETAFQLGLNRVYVARV
jgi:hypothetical protein